MIATAVNICYIIGNRWIFYNVCPKISRRLKIGGLLFTERQHSLVCKFVNLAMTNMSVCPSVTATYGNLVK